MVLDQYERELVNRVADCGVYVFAAHVGCVALVP